MTGRKAYQMALLASVVLGLVGAVIAVLGWLSWAVSALALSVAALAAALHLRTLVILRRGGSVNGAVDAAALDAFRSTAESVKQEMGDLQRAQAAAESFILADLLALRQRVNTLIEMSERNSQEKAQ